MNNLIRSFAAQALILILGTSLGSAQEPATAPAGAPKLNILIISGDGAINNMKSRTARETIVEVQDENNKPVAGAAVVFVLPTSGPGVVAQGGSNLISTVTDANGRAVARGLRPNTQPGQYNVQVRANFQQSFGQTVISQTNVVAAGAAVSGLTIGLIIAGVVGGVVAGVVATQGGGSSTRPSVGVNPGNPSAGPPR